MLILLWLLVCLIFFPDSFFEYFDTPVFIAIITGFVTNVFYARYEEKGRLNRLKRNLRQYVGVYDVYHWRDLMVPDKCKYEVEITLTTHGFLSINHTGLNDYDHWTSDVMIDPISLNFGASNYFHPQKHKNEFGRISIFLINSHTINVDKSYIDMQNESAFIPCAEKWQWRKQGSN